MRAQTSVLLKLLALSALLGGGLALLGFPAALLLGAMVAAIIMAVTDHTIPLHRFLPVLAQTVIGQLMAQTLSLKVLHEIVAHWTVFLGGVFSVVLISFALGWVLARLRVMPGSTALWGASPGAATAMLLLCENYGADQRLVAFMVYLRVLMVTVITSIIVHLTRGASITPHVVTLQHDFVLWPCLVIIALSTLLAMFIRKGTAPLLLSMTGGILLQAGFDIHSPPPVWLLSPSYIIIGWMIGRRFTPDVIHHVRRILPIVLLSTTVLIASCALMAWPLAHIAHVDVLTAYLATSPGGADSIAIIAASSPIDMPFVMAMQIARFITLLFVAPIIATSLARLLPPGSAQGNGYGI